MRNIHNDKIPRRRTRLRGSGIPNGIEFVIQLSLDWQLKYILQFKFKLINTCNRINGKSKTGKPTRMNGSD